MKKVTDGRESMRRAGSEESNVKRRAHRGYLIITMAVAIGSGLRCNQVDEDPDPVLADLAGPGATACGSMT